MNYIQYIHEPRRLLLVWQRPEEDGAARVRRAVAELLRDSAGRVQLRYLTDTDDLDAAKQEGFISFPAFRKLNTTYDLGVVETFMRRLPPRSRGDYAQYLDQFRLRRETPISDFALLGYTGAKLPSDGFSILDPLEDVGDACDVLMEVAGFRHVSAHPAESIALGAPAALVPQDNNLHDAAAVAVEIGGERVGYVPRQQASAIRRLLATADIQAQVERINGRSGRPLVYLWVRFKRRAAQPRLPPSAAR